jgi:L-amino acid N-acyltransferase YncA
MTGEIHVRALEPGDWPQVREIFLEGIASGHATFETAAPPWQTWDATHLEFGRLVAVADDAQRIIGWSALSPTSNRSAYSGVAEVSVYVAAGFRGQGIGRLLMSRMINESEANGIWTLQASVFPENVASVTLHEAFGFRKIGFRERVARLNDRWRDTIVLERRSQIVGADDAVNLSAKSG